MCHEMEKWRLQEELQRLKQASEKLAAKEFDYKVGENSWKIINYLLPPPKKKRKTVLNLHRLIGDKGALVFGAMGDKSAYQTNCKLFQMF